MIRAARDLIRRLGFVSVLLLALVFAAPAFESHACADAERPSGVMAGVAAVDAGPGDDASCADCGPACANGCCHAPHSAVATENPGPRPLPRFAQPLAWTDCAGVLMTRPSGPDRPPRA